MAYNTIFFYLCLSFMLFVLMLLFLFIICVVLCVFMFSLVSVGALKPVPECGPPDFNKFLGPKARHNLKTNLVLKSYYKWTSDRVLWRPDYSLTFLVYY